MLNLLVFVSCKTNNYENNNKLYRNDKSYFPEKFVNHFPETIYGDNLLNSRYHTDGGTNTLFELVSTIDSTNINLVNKLKENSIANYRATDTCLNIVNRLYTFKTRFSKNLHFSKKEKERFFIPCIIENYPVPNFYENTYVDTELKNRLTSDFEIYIIEAKSGKFWNEKN